MAFAGTGAWTTWATKTITVPVNAGSNTIRATATTATAGPTSTTSTSRSAAAGHRVPGGERAISQGVVESNHAGFTGTGFVNYNNVAGSYVEWHVYPPPPAASR